MRNLRTCVTICFSSFCFVICAAMSGCSDKKGDSADANAQPGNTSIAKTPKPAAKPEQPSDSKADPYVEAKKKEERAKADKEKVRPSLEQEATQAEEAIRNATVLQAPPFGNSTPKDPTWSNIDDFGQRIRDLASNEFKLREAKVFRSTFNQKNVQYTPSIKSFLARNAVVSPGKYDFDSGHYSLDLMFWQAIAAENKFGDVVFPRVEDTCKLRATIKVDPKTAQRWREAIDRGTFSLSIWYRLAKVEQASWKQNPSWTIPMLAHDIAFAVEILKFEEANPLALEKEKARQREAEPAAEKAKRRADALEAERLQQEKEFKDLPRQIAVAQAALVVEKDKLRMIRLAENSGTYPYTGAMPADYFDAVKKKYIYYGKSQRLARTKRVSEEINRLTAEISSKEAKIAAQK